MANAVAVSSIMQRVRRMADMENTSFVTDAELIQYINASAQDLYDRLVSAYGDDYYTSVTPVTSSISSATDTYSLPSDFYKLKGVDLLVAGSQWTELPRVSFRDRNALSMADTIGGPGFGYRPVGLNSICLWPKPTQNGTIRVWYIPYLTHVTGSSDTVEGINGWEDYVVVDCAIKCLSKEESDTSDLQLRKAELIKRIQSMADERDTANVDVIRDVRSSRSPWPWRFVGR